MRKKNNVKYIKYLVSLIIIFTCASFLKVYPFPFRKFVSKICRVSWNYVVILHNSRAYVWQIFVFVTGTLYLIPCATYYRITWSVNYQTLQWRESARFSPYTKRKVNPSIYSRESATSSSSGRMLRNCLIVNERYLPLITSRITYVPLIAFLRATRHGYRKYIKERSRAPRSKIVRLVNFHRKR